MLHFFFLGGCVILWGCTPYIGGGRKYYRYFIVFFALVIGFFSHDAEKQKAKKCNSVPNGRVDLELNSVLWVLFSSTNHGLLQSEMYAFVSFVNLFNPKYFFLFLSVWGKNVSSVYNNPIIVFASSSSAFNAIFSAKCDLSIISFLPYGYFSEARKPGFLFNLFFVFFICSLPQVTRWSMLVCVCVCVTFHRLLLSICNKFSLSLL